MKNIYRKSGLPAILVTSGLAISLSACDVSLSVDEKTLASLGDIKTGVISLVGDSVAVDGAVYDTTNATVVADGVETDASALKEGMVVSVQGTMSSDGAGVANRIIYNDELEGMVTSVTVLTDADTNAVSGVITVLGQTVKVDGDTVFESDDANDLSIADIDEGNVVEVSGYATVDGDILATRIEVKAWEYIPGEKIELKGNVANLNDATFDIGGLTIDIGNARFDDGFSGALQNGQRVEVSSYEGYDGNGNLIANEIELKNKSDQETRDNDVDGNGDSDDNLESEYGRDGDDDENDRDDDQENDRESDDD